MHIAHFTNTYHPVISGVVRSVSTFRQALSDLGHNVFVFAQNVPNYEDQEPFIFRYPALNLGLPNDFPATIPFSPFIDNLFPPLKVEVIHSHHPVLLGQAAANKAEDYGLPLVFTFHTRYREYSHYFPLSQDFVQDFVKEAIDSWLKYYIARCHHIVAPSESTRQILMNQYGVKNRITVIPTGIQLELFQNLAREGVREECGWGDDFVLISVGRLAREKNWGTLLEAFKIVSGNYPKVRLVIIGDGPERVDLQDLVVDMNLRGKVELTGKLPFDQIPGYLKAADLFCFASVSETQGLVTIEAMAAGLPVVAVDATGTRDVLEHDKEGFLTENDSQALARAIQLVLEDKGLFWRYKEAAANKAHSFSIQRLAKQMLGVYQQALETQKANLFVEVEGETSGEARKSWRWVSRAARLGEN